MALDQMWHWYLSPSEEKVLMLCSSPGTSTCLPTEGTGGRFHPVNHQLLDRKALVDIAVLSLISAIFLFVSSTFSCHLTVRMNRCCWSYISKTGRCKGADS